ncbi:MAG: hypothetical protein AAGF11_44460 [Myxococcota bacterium]
MHDSVAPGLGVGILAEAGSAGFRGWRAMLWARPSASSPAAKRLSEGAQMSIDCADAGRLLDPEGVDSTCWSALSDVTFN